MLVICNFVVVLLQSALILEMKCAIEDQVIIITFVNDPVTRIRTYLSSSLRHQILLSSIRHFINYFFFFLFFFFQRKKFVSLNEELLMLGSYFLQNTQIGHSVPKDMIPPHIKHCFTIDGSNVTINSLYSDSSNDLVSYFQSFQNVFLFVLACTCVK